MRRNESLAADGLAPAGAVQQDSAPQGQRWLPAAFARWLQSLAALALLRRLPGRRLRMAALLGLAVALAWIWVNSYVVSFSGHMDSCCVSDWLISYAGGFVRRGLAGTAILAASEAIGISPRVALLLILGCAYLAIFLPLAVIVLRARDLTLLDLLLVLSPFAALFPVFHQIAGQRKEVLLLAAAGIAYLTDLGRLDGIFKQLLWGMLLAVIVAAHDALFFCLPLFVLYLELLTPAAHRPRRGAILFILAPAAAVFLVGYARSGHADLGAICAAMERAAQGAWCTPHSSGEFIYASSWLQARAIDGIRSVAARYSTLSAVRTLLIGTLGIVPVAVAFTGESAARATLRELPQSRWFCAAAVIGVLLLFVVASDWNRWFYITTSLITMMYFAARRARA